MNAHPKLAIETAPQLAVCLANRPGAPARVCEARANAGINILRVEYTISRVVAHGKRSDHPATIRYGKTRRVLEEL